MLKVPKAEAIFTVPRLVFTLKGNPKSEAVVKELLELERLAPNAEQAYAVFAAPEEVLACFKSGISSAAAVCLFDGMGTRGFRMMTANRPTDAKVMPSWAFGSQWAVKVHSPNGPARCARQVRSDFLMRFSRQFANKQFPWGLPRKGEKAAGPIGTLAKIDGILERLNRGPDFRSSISDKARLAELPDGSRISWIRVANEPIVCDLQKLTAILEAIRAFEAASWRMVESLKAWEKNGAEALAVSSFEGPDIRPMLLAGVTLADPTLAKFYLHPPSRGFSLGRLDLHYTGEGLFASENDEMPGGFAEAVHIDVVYGINQERWYACFRELTERGPLLFLVSDQWSQCYIEDFRWLAAYLQSLGYPVSFAATSELDDLDITPAGVSFRGAKVETIWRQFPVFETVGRLADLVRLASAGKIRMIPEFAHYGNKAWYAIFRKCRCIFAETLDPQHLRLLDEVMPDSHLIADGTSLPCRVAGEYIADLDRLRCLPPEIRNRLVLKVCGANVVSARSYGLLMGHGLKDRDWQEWINERLELGQPFIIQRRVETAVITLPVQNISRGVPELFGCRIMLRPWTLNGQLISASAIAVPSNTERVHGLVDMAVLPVVFE